MISSKWVSAAERTGLLHNLEEMPGMTVSAEPSFVAPANRINDDFLDRHGTLSIIPFLVCEYLEAGVWNFCNRHGTLSCGMNVQCVHGIKKLSGYGIP